MKKILTGILFLVFLLPGPALAGDSGFYVSGTLGIGSNNTTSLDDATVSNPEGDFEENIWDLSDIEFGSDGNFNGLLAIGKRLGKSYRIELEYGYRNSYITHFRSSTSGYQQVDSVYLLCHLNLVRLVQVHKGIQ